MRWLWRHADGNVGKTLMPTDFDGIDEATAAAASLASHFGVPAEVCTSACDGYRVLALLSPAACRGGA